MTVSQNKKSVWTFAAASFLNDFGSDIIYPLWPFFVTSVLGANMAVLGFLDGLGDALVSLSQAGSGYLSDRTQKRKVFVWTGYLMGALSRVGYAMSTVWQMLIPFRVLDRAGKMRGAPRDAMVADASTLEDRGRTFGLLRSMDNLGAVCGIVFCMIFFHLGYRTLFLLAAIPSLLSVLLILFRIKENPVSPTRTFKGLRLKDLTREFRLFLVLSTIFSLGTFSYSILLLFAKTRGTSDSSSPLLYLVFTLVAALLSWPFGRLSDSLGRKTVLILSFVIWGATCTLALMAYSSIAFALVFVLYGLHRAAIEPVQKAFVSELAPQALRASALGGYQLVTGLSALPSSLIAGILWDSISPSAPFIVSIALTACATTMLIFMKQPGVKEQ